METTSMTEAYAYAKEHGGTVEYNAMSGKFVVKPEPPKKTGLIEDTVNFAKKHPIITAWFLSKSRLT